MKTPQRSKSLQIYVKPGIREDDVLIGVWEACARYDRPQDVFRTMLRRGLIAMVESGEMPEAVIDECGLDLVIERRRRKSGKSRTTQQDSSPQYPQHSGAHSGYAPVYVAPQAPYPHSHPQETAWRGSEEHQPRHPAYERQMSEPRTTEDRGDYSRRDAEEKNPATAPPTPPTRPLPEKRADPLQPSEQPAKGNSERQGQGRKLGNLM